MATVENVEKMKVTFPNIKMLEKSAQISGHEFLVANAQREGVTTTVSGLQYEIIKVGTGPKPKAEDQVKCHYHCTSILGKVIDSTVDRGEPVVFQTDLAIAGCAEALQLMPVGSKWKLYIPSELGEEIKPNSALIFEIELLEILK
jgi:FKBP-type peptidyl-prolyl cis-trans isomerase FklB